jgi:uncharacterized protein (TIGR02996 family)
MSMASADRWLQDPIYRGLLDDVIENPDDDTPRLVMADWLEEHGDQVAQDRARFIRLQVRRAKFSEYSPEAWASRREEARLLRTHRLAWLGRLDRFISKATFRRGFPDDLVLGVAQFVRNANTLFTLTPVRQLQLLRIAQTKLTMTDLAAIPGMARLRGLSIRNSNLGDERVRELLATLSMPHLESLDLTGCYIGPQSLDALAHLPVPRLRALSLASNTIVDRVERVTQTVAQRPLQSLNLSFTALDANAIAALANWSGLATLEYLNLSGTNMGARAATSLLESPYLGSLETLILNHCSIRRGGAAALARCSALQRLRVLQLDGNELSESGLVNLASGPYLTSLEHLDLANNGLSTDEALVALGRWPAFASVRSLRLDHNVIAIQGLRHFLAGEHLGSLTSLSLVGTDLRTGVGSVLAASPKLSSLAHLNLTYNSLKSVDLEAILNSPNLTNLCELLVPPTRWGPELTARLEGLTLL